jgi:hypothetical protein
MADNTAGSVNVDIKGNLAPFEAALAKGRQMANAFDAEVSKKLSGSSATDANIAKIAAAVEQTNAMLAKLTGTATPAAAAVAKLSTESTRASAAITGVGTSSVSAASSVGRLATEANTVAASIQRAVAANQQFAASNLQMADGSAARAADIQAYGAALDDIRAKYNPLFRVTREYLTLKEELRIATKLGAISEGEAASALSRGRQETLAAIGVLKGHTGALNDHAHAAGLGTAQTMALTHAVRSFVEQIALGISPLQALTSQMNHLSFVASGPGGPRAAIASIGTSVASAASRIGSFVASSTILRTLGTAALAASLGFEAIRDRASEAEHRSVGFGETISAVFQTLGNYIHNSAVGTVFDAIATAASYAFGKLGSAAVDVAELVINSFHAAYTDIVAGWRSFPDQLGAFFVGAANNGIAALNMLVKKASDAVDEISKALNNIPGVDIPLLNAGDQAIKPLDNKYLDNLKKEVADRNAEIERIMKSTPLRTFASDVVDQIATNHALEGLDALKNISFDSATNSANGFSSAIGGIGSAASGVTVQFGGMSQQVINVSRAFEDAKLAQLGQIQGATNELHKMQNEATELQKTLAAASQAKIADVFGKGFAGNADAATQAISRTVNAVDRLFAAYDSGNATIGTVHESLELLRQTLLAQGGDPVAINAFFDSIVSGEIKVRQLNSTVNTLHDSIASLPNKTVTITVVTKQIGSGTQSQYSVPNQTGGYSGVGVTRYGAAPGSQSGPSISANTVPSTGYGSQGGYGDSSTGTVTVTRFGGTRAAGGPVSPGLPYWVGEHGPELVVPSGAGSVVPNGQSTALANAQSGFTGREPTRETDRLWQVFMNIEANTRKTYEGVDKWGLASSNSGGSSYGGGGSSSAYNDNSQSSAYARVLAQVKANFHAAGIVGSGSIGYGGQGLAATPEQIARNIVNGTSSSLGSPGANDYESTLAQTQVAHAQSEARRYQSIYGMATGGIDSSDTEHVEFFKNPNEKVIVATPQQFADVRPGAAGAGTAGSADQRPIQISMPIYLQAGAQMNKDSTAELRRQVANAVRDGLRSVNGR